MAKTIEITIENHPAQARDPFTNEPLVDAAGKPVPLLADQKCIKLDGGRIIGYLFLESGKTSFIVPESKLGPIAAAAKAKVKEYLATQAKEPAGEHFVADVDEDDTEVDEDE